MSTPADLDLVVVGAGLAGLTTAVRAGQLGLRVAVLEQGNEAAYPCNSRYSGGIFHVSYHDPKADPALLRQAIERVATGVARPDLVEAIAVDAGRSIDWLAAAGARFVRGAISWHAWVLAPPRPLTTGLDWQGRGADVALQELTRRLLEGGGALMLGTRATSLLMRDGACRGVRAQREGGSVDFDAKAVVIADGGFQGSDELFRRHIGPCPQRVVQRGASTGVGDGLGMALAAGAAAGGLDRFYGHVLSRDALSNDNLWPYPQIDAIAAAAIVVDPSGRRFLDEGLGGVYIANRLAGLDDPACATVICDASVWEGPGREAQIAPNPLLEREGGTLHRAGTLAELARTAGIDPDALVETVARYNAAVDGDQASGLSPSRSTGKVKAWPIRRAPFLAIPVCAGITHTMGGISVDGHGRVLRSDDTAIAGLYAAGTTTAGLEGGPRAAYVGGLIKASVLGLRVAEDVARLRSVSVTTQDTAEPGHPAAHLHQPVHATVPGGGRFPVLGAIVRFGAIGSLVLAGLVAALVFWVTTGSLGLLSVAVAALAGGLTWGVARSYVELVTLVKETLLPR